MINMCELDFQHKTHTDIVNSATKQYGEQGGKDESEEEGVLSINHSVAMQCVDTSLDYKCQRGFTYSSNTATRRIHTAKGGV
jgi:hypothetical protein